MKTEPIISSHPGRMTRALLEERERSMLSPFGTLSGESLGRLYDEEEHDYRTAFQRDRDRLIHCTAFRRLEYKTQVFVNHEGDYYRTRLTHTLEVVQIARSLARVLSLNEDLAEAMALAHDLGHTPFGHTVEGVLNDLLSDEAGFEHNAQGLRCVDILETPYSRFQGLNLTYEVRSIFTKKNSMAELRRRGYTVDASSRFDPGPPQPILEAQVVDIADSVAYNSHDIDDGLKAGLLSPAVLERVPIWTHIWPEAEKNAPSTRRRAAVRELINRQIIDVADETIKRLEELSTHPDSSQTSGEYPPLRDIPRVVDFSPEMREQDARLKEALHSHLYRHPRVTRQMDKACAMIRDLFQAYCEHPEQMAPEFSKRAQDEPLKRVVCDYIAGMTDRFAEEEYLNLNFPDSARFLHR